jgi:serine O-acetyltransferase
MRLALETADLRALLRRQLSALFACDEARDGKDLDGAIDHALEACRVCFAPVRNKYYRRDGASYFDPFHAGQYTIFLYYAGRAALKRRANPSLADRIYYLNRALNAVDLHPDVALPEIFLLDHPLGTVIGRGRFANYFSFSQGCTVGNNHGHYPSFGHHVVLYANVSVIGRCVVGDHAVFAARTTVIDADIPARSLVFGQSPHLTIKPLADEDLERHRLFDD